MRTLARVAVCCLAAALAGCGDSKPYKTADVSGRITLDGKPLAGARVIFNPIHDPKDGALGRPEAYGTTDADGRYTLETAFRDRGATVGPNRVTVSTIKREANPANPEAIKIVAPERVPLRYSNAKDMLKFEVTDKGSDSANFDLTSK
jgi:hypothetical protein